MVDWLSLFISGSSVAFSGLLVWVTWIQIRKQFPSDTKVAVEKLTEQLQLLEKHVGEVDTDVAVILAELENAKDGAERTIDAINRVEDRLNHLER